jgi:D-alanyl-D-alanine carboxypeptidase (penicillin-binding protein 5/6)
VRRPLPLRRLTAVLLATGALLLSAAVPALAEGTRPTVDPSAPTPTTPYPGPPPQGSAPDGSTVGGEGLDTRGVVTVPGAPALPVGVDAHGWLVADLGTGQVLAAQDPHGRYYPASTLKTLTLLTLAPRLDHGLVVTATTEDEAIEGSRVGLVHDGRYPVDLLFRALVMQSGNDAANALARAAGGVGATLQAMNATAERIGAFDTVAGTPSGLDVAGQSSSPYDLALIMRQLVADPYTLSVLQTRTAEVPAVGGLPGYQIQSQDTLLDSYPGTLGGKTGFTDAARHTFVAAAERNGGFATAPDAHGIGRLVAPGEVSATASPTVAVPTPSASASTAATAAATPSAGPASSGSAIGDSAISGSAISGPAIGDSPVLPAALAGGALLIVAATVVARHRARRPVPADQRTVRRPPPARPHSGSPGGPATEEPAGPPPRPPAHRRPAAPGPAGPARDQPPAPGPGRPPAAE